MRDVNSRAREILQTVLEATNLKPTKLKQGISTEKVTPGHQNVSSVPLLQTRSIGPQTSNLSGNVLSEEPGSSIPPGIQSFIVPWIS